MGALGRLPPRPRLPVLYGNAMWGGRQCAGCCGGVGCRDSRAGVEPTEPGRSLRGVELGDSTGWLPPPPPTWWGDLSTVGDLRRYGVPEGEYGLTFRLYWA